MILPFLDHAGRHHAKRIAGWLVQPGWRSKPHFILAHWPHLDPIQRRWGLVHRHLPDKASHASFKQFSEILRFLREKASRDRPVRRGRFPVDLRIISPRDFWVPARGGYRLCAPVYHR